MKIQALHLYNFMEYAQVRGVDQATLLKCMQETPVPFLDEKATVETEDFYAVLIRINSRLGDVLLGVRLGEFMSLKSLGLIYQISLQATTVEEALFYLKHYLNASLPLVSIQTHIQENSATIQLDIDNEYTAENRIILELILAVIARELKMMAYQGLEIHLASPYYDSAYPKNWQAGNVFSLTFANTILKSTLQDKSKWQLDILVPAYLQMIEGLKAQASFSTHVKIAILNMAKPQLPDLEKVADAFNMTARTFQRRLDTENTTFRYIHTELKKQISYLLIGHNRFSVADIADILGFSEPASFIHSFKKWHGNSPEKFRQQLSRISISSNLIP